jgi:hypothetical protein
MINWPTAFVIAVAMICGAVLINKPSDAAFGGDGGMIATSGAPDGQTVWHLKDGAVRRCYNDTVSAFAHNRSNRIFCSLWSD